MAYDDESGQAEATGLHLFQEVNKVRVKPGLGIFTDPHPDLTPDEDGKVPVYTKSTDSFEVMRLKTTKVRIDRFIQENKEDLKAEGMLPESLDLASTVAAGVYTEKALRSFLGDGEETESHTPAYTTYGRGETSVYDNDDFEMLEWKTGMGWVKKEGAKKTTPSYGSTSWSWEGDEEWKGGYRSSSYGYRSSHAPKKKKYRMLAEQLAGIKEEVRKEMFEGALKVLEDPADLSRVILVKLLDKVDVMDLKPLAEWEVNGIIRDLMSDIRWDVGYSSRYRGLLKQVEDIVTDMVWSIHADLPTMLAESESPERLMVDIATLIDVKTEEQKRSLRGMFTAINQEKNAEAEAEAMSAEEDQSSEEEIDEKDIHRAPDDQMRLPTYTHDPVVWGRLRVIEHPLIPDSLLRKKTVTWKATDIGAHIGRIDRILTDQRIFREMRPTDSGSLLVDCSGSMGLHVKDVYKVLEKVPGAVIGLYSGSGGGGILHIVARNGKVAANLEAIIGSALRLGGNVVDGPSLEWLGTMPQPRIWYSDGGVTGLRDAGGHNLRDSANHLMQVGKIWRIRNQKKLPAAFKQMRKEQNVGRISSH